MGGQVLHVSISAETIFHIFGLAISNSILTSLLVTFFLVLFALFFHQFKFKQTHKPGALQNFVEMIVEALYNFVYSITENTKKTMLFFPVIATFFIFIILNNYIGLLPGVGSIMVEKAHETAIKLQRQFPALAKASQEQVAEEATVTMTEADSNQEGLDPNQENAALAETHVEQGEQGEEGEVESHSAKTPLLRAATADLNTTLALAIISVFLTQFYGVSHLGLSYFKKFIDFSNPINFFVGILETVLEFAKIVSFAFRLFGNVFAGEVLLLVMTYLVAIVAPAPFYALELFVGFIQALVFSMLSLIFFNLATKGHHEESHELASN